MLSLCLQSVPKISSLEYRPGVYPSGLSVDSYNTREGTTVERDFGSDELVRKYLSKDNRTIDGTLSTHAPKITAACCVPRPQKIRGESFRGTAQIREIRRLMVPSVTPP